MDGSILHMNSRQQMEQLDFPSDDDGARLPAL